jgi:hypothetical protein
VWWLFTVADEPIAVARAGAEPVPQDRRLELEALDHVHDRVFVADRAD